MKRLPYIPGLNQISGTSHDTRPRPFFDPSSSMVKNCCYGDKMQII